MIASILILDQCGRLWTQLWKTCLPSNSDELDIPISITYGIATAKFNVNFMALKHQTICSSKNILQINSYANKCLRQFFDEWGIIIVSKVLLFLTMPLWIYIYQTSTFSQKLNKYKCCSKERSRESQHKRTEDSKLIGTIDDSLYHELTYESLIGNSIDKELFGEYSEFEENESLKFEKLKNLRETKFKMSEEIEEQIIVIDSEYSMITSKV